jgi:hypothetical protein
MKNPKYYDPNDTPHSSWVDAIVIGFCVSFLLVYGIFVYQP